MATLAVGLGFSLASSQAIGYPAGASVSMGENPIQSFGGRVSVDGSETLLPAHPTQDFIVTDVRLMAKSTDNGCMDKIDIELLADDSVLAAYNVSTSYEREYFGNHTPADSVQDSMVSGLRVAAGQSLALQTSTYDTFTYGGCSGSRSASVVYTLSGYYSQP